MVKIKISYNNYILLFSLILSFYALSCVEETTGYISLKDPDPPSLELLNLTNNQVILDTISSVSIQVKASDYFGVSQVYLIVNGKVVAPWQSQSNQSVLLSSVLLIDTSLIGKENIVYALARDVSSNTATTLPIKLTVRRTLINKNNFNQLSILDRGNLSQIDLDTVFVDTLANSTLTYQLLGNTNPKLLQPELIGKTLKINQKPYLSGRSTVTIKASTGKRYLVQKIDIKVGLLSPLKKVFMPDSIFRNLLRDRYGFTDLEEDSIVQDQADTLQYLSTRFVNPIYGWTQYRNMSYEGIKSFKNLLQASIYGGTSSRYSFCDLSHCTHLKNLYTEQIYTENLNISELNELEYLNVFNGSIDSLNPGNYPKLKTLIIGGQFPINNLNVSRNINLEELDVAVYHPSVLKAIDLSTNNLLKKLTLRLTSLTELDLSKNIQLKYINITQNESLIKTYVWTLPLPGDVTMQKDTINNLYKK